MVTFLRGSQVLPPKSQLACCAAHILGRHWQHQIHSLMQSEYQDIVIFFDGSEPGQEMLMQEFEALLDHVVSAPEYADQLVKGAFLRIAPGLKPKALVLFLLHFDGQGCADGRWNLPLDYFAIHAAHGPDLGAGPVRLATYSTCPVTWHQKQLWDPESLGDSLAEGEPTPDVYALIAALVRRNKLALPTECEPPDLALDQIVKPAPAAQAAQPQAQASQLEAQAAKPEAQAAQSKAQAAHSKAPDAQPDEEQKPITPMGHDIRVKIARMKSRHREDLQNLKLEFHRQLKEALRKSSELKGKAQHQEKRAIQFKKQLEDQVRLLKSEQNRFTVQLSEAREMIEMRNSELVCREQQMSELREEIARLRQLHA